MEWLPESAIAMDPSESKQSPWGMFSLAVPSAPTGPSIEPTLELGPGMLGPRWPMMVRTYKGVHASVHVCTETRVCVERTLPWRSATRSEWLCVSVNSKSSPRTIAAYGRFSVQTSRAPSTMPRELSLSPSHVVTRQRIRTGPATSTALVPASVYASSQLLC
jgi:hypothetical protein